MPKEPYNYEKTWLIVKGMTNLLVLDFVDETLMMNQVVYNWVWQEVPRAEREQLLLHHGQFFSGKVSHAAHGRPHPYHTHGTENFKDYAGTVEGYTSSTEIIMAAMMKLFEKITDKTLFAQHINVLTCRVKLREKVTILTHYEQLGQFTDYTALEW